MIKTYAIDQSNVDSVVSIHRRAYLDDHFSSTMNNKYLKRYYLALASVPNSLSFYCEDESGPIGFVIAGEGLNNVVKKFVEENGLYLLTVVLSNPQFLWAKSRALFTRFAKKKVWTSRANTRVLSVAVDPERQGGGLGWKMLEIFERHIESHYINIYGLSVKNSNAKAIAFYKKHGFEIEYSDKKSSYYFKEL